MDVIKLLNELEEWGESRREYFSICIDFHRDEFLELTNRIRAALPEDVKRGARLSAEKERVLDGARMSAEQTLEEAQAQAEQILRDARASAEKMLREADADAGKLVTDARTAAERLSKETEAEADDLLTTSRAKAEQMLRDAHQQAQQMINQSEVARLATAQAREIVSTAEYDAKDLRRGADEYAHGVMTDLERQIRDLLATIERGRNKLDQRVRAHEEPKNYTNGRSPSNELTGTHR